MKRIGKSAWPTLKTVQNITANLRKNFNRSFFIDIEVHAHLLLNLGDYADETKISLSILPGNSEGCTLVYFNSWPELLAYYHRILKEGLFNG